MASQLPVLFQSLSIQRGLTTNIQPTFPMQDVPRYGRCDYQPKHRTIVSPHNPNGNAGRPYYFCIKCQFNRKCGVSTNGFRKGWISWDDDRGIQQNNPPCHCRSMSRQDKAGIHSSHPGRGFWTCATGSCAYFSFRLDGLTDAKASSDGAAPDAGFEPWLI